MIQAVCVYVSVLDEEGILYLRPIAGDEYLVFGGPESRERSQFFVALETCMIR